MCLEGGCALHGTLELQFKVRLYLNNFLEVSGEVAPVKNVAAQSSKTRNALEWVGLEAGPRLLMGPRLGLRHSRL